MKRILVTGAGGFIGSHLVASLKRDGHWVRGADLKRPEFNATEADEFLLADLRMEADCAKAMQEIDEVYALAADMGGMGFIANNNALILHNNSLIDLLTIEAAHRAKVKRLLYASSACIYPEHLQTTAEVTPLKESDAYPADPQDAYGWEKILGEQLCRHYRLDFGLDTRVVRLHNVFGPYGTWEGGREKAPAAVCRKVAEAKLTGASSVEIWGDGLQTRSFLFVEDCVRGLKQLMASSHVEPINLGQDELVTINELVAMVSGIAGHPVKIEHVPGPQGVRGRNCDATLAAKVLGWSPKIGLAEGLRRTYPWIEQQVTTALASRRSVAK